MVSGARQELLRKLYRFEKLAELDPVELERRLLEQDSEEDDGADDDQPESAGFLDEGVQKRGCSEDREMVARGVCKRLELWKEADFGRIDTVVERDLRSDLCGWIGRDGEQVSEAATEIEVAIFGLMLEELTEELACFP